MRTITTIIAALLMTTSAVEARTPVKKVMPAAKPAGKPVTKPAVQPPKLVPLPDTEEAAQLRRAFRFAFPIYEMMRTRSLQLGAARGFGLPNAVNFILPRLKLADATARDVTTPNNDTLYGSVWLDLAAGPVIIDMPALPGRYNSAALMGVNTDVTSIIGTRTGSRGGRYAYVGPGYTGPTPDGAELVRATSNDAWLLIRVLVNGEEDLAAAGAAIGGYKVSLAADRAAAAPAIQTVPVAPDAQTFLAVVNEALARSAGSSALIARANGFAAQGLTTQWESITPETRALWTRAMPALRAELKSGLSAIGDVVDGWSYPKLAIGEYGEDDDLRSYVALGGLGALPRLEAMYLSARVDAAGEALSGDKPYTVHLPPGLPVGAFWSLTMYQIEADGRLFFVPNELSRYAIGDRSPQLRSNRDGSYDIFIQTNKPSGERVVNWLPAPKGKFSIVFRGYLPRAPLLDSSFRLPAVAVTERIE